MWRHNFPGFDVLGFGPKDSKNSYNHLLSWRNFVRVSFFQLFVLCYRNISWSDRIDGDPARHENQGCKIKCTECLAGLEGFDCCTETRRQHSGKHRRATTTTSRPTFDQNYCSRPEIQLISCCAKGLEHTMSFFPAPKSSKFYYFILMSSFSLQFRLTGYRRVKMVFLGLEKNFCRKRKNRKFLFSVTKPRLIEKEHFFKFCLTLVVASWGGFRRQRRQWWRQ